MDIFDLTATIRLEVDEYLSGLKIAESKTANFSKKTTSGFSKLAKLGVAALAGATGAITGFAATAISAGKDFDQSMSQVAATMGKSVDEMTNEVGHASTSFGEFEGNLREFAQFMGQNTAFSATQAADALNYMALAGYSTQQSMDMLPNVLSLAAAGAMDLATASDMVTDTQTAFGISAERTAQMVDEMAKAASTGNTSVQQLGNAFLVVGGLAQDLNGGMVTLENGTTQAVDGVQELEIALTAMANAGIKGGEAGTHMRNMLLKLSSPTEKAQKLFDKLGIKVFDTDGKMRSLKNIFADLNAGLSTLTQEEKLQAISEIFNARDVASAESLLKAVGEDWDKIGESILDAEGAASKMAEVQLDNLEGDVTLFRSALEGAQIAVSDHLSPALRDFVQFGTKGLSELTTAFQENGFEGAIDALGDILSDGITLIIEKIPDMIDAGVKLISALIKGLVKNKNKLFKAAQEIVRTFTKAIGEAVPGVKTVMNTIQDIIDGVFEFIKENGPMIEGIINGILMGFLAYKTAIVVIEGVSKAIALVSTATKVLNGELALTSAINPFGALAAGVGLLVGAITAVTAAEEAAMQERYESIAAIPEEMQQALDFANEYKARLDGVYESNMNIKRSVEEQLQPEKDLLTELQGIVDENGLVKQGYEERAAVIAGQLSESFGIEIEMQNGVIAKYDEVMGKIDEVIAKKQAEAILDANRDEYYNSLKSQLTLYSDMDAAQKAYNETYQQYLDKRKEVTQMQYEYATGQISDIDLAKGWGAEFAVAINDMKALQEKLGGLKETLSESTEEYYRSQDFISDYNNLNKVVTEGVGDLDRAVTDMTNNVIEAAPQKVLNEQAQEAQNYLSALLEMREKGVAVTDEQIADATERLASAVDAMKGLGEDGSAGYAEGLKETDDVIEAAKKMVEDAEEEIKTAQDSHSPSRLFKKQGVNAAEGYGKGIEDKQGWLNSVIESLMNDVKTKFTEKTPEAREWGRDLMKNFIDGIKSEMAELESTVKQVGQVISDNLEHSHPKDGPLANDYTWMPDMMELFAEGIENNADMVRDAAVNAFDFKDAISSPDMRTSSANAGGVNLNRVVELLQDIADNGMSVALEGDAAGIFTVVETENKRRTKATRYNALSMVRY